MFRPFFVGVDRQGGGCADVHSLEIFDKCENVLQTVGIHTPEEPLVLLQILEKDVETLRDFVWGQKGEALQKSHRVCKLRTLCAKSLQVLFLDVAVKGTEEVEYTARDLIKNYSY